MKPEIAEFDHGRSVARPWILLCAVGAGLRLAFLLLAGPLELQSDEANYVYLAATWNYFGFYSDSYRYLWPPGYPFLLGLGLRLFGAEGLFAIKLLQVAASVSTGWFTMLLARRVFGARAALLAGAGWAFYLPLVGFTHYLWTETFFLALFTPCLYCLLVAMQSAGGDRAGTRALLTAGVLFGLSLYLKEAHLYLAPLLAAVLFLWRGAGHLGEGFRHASLFGLTVVTVVAPWTLRNQEVYGKFIPLGASLGENCYLGLNASYRNFDTTPFARHRLDREFPASRQWFVEVNAEPWERAEEIVHIHDKSQEGARRGMAFARANPGWFVRSRIKKLADFAAPVSFFTRHHGLDRYDGAPLGALPVRRSLVVLSVLLSAALLLLGGAGFLGLRRDRAFTWLSGAVVAYFLATACLVAMSRFRVPIVPLLLVFAAGWLTATGPTLTPRRKRLALVTTTVVLGALWWIDLPEISGGVTMAWEPAP